MDALFALPYGPLLIFAMRVVDVSMGAVRVVLVVRGSRKLAAAVGFVEVLLWIVAVGSAMQHLTSLYHLAGYAGGFATGTYAGVAVGSALPIGQVVVRAILPDGDGGTTAQALRERGYAVTEIDGRGQEGPVDILNAVVGRQEASQVADIVDAVASRSFITVEEVRTARQGAPRLLASGGAQGPVRK